MSEDLKTKIAELERELELKRGYQSVQFTFPKSCKLSDSVIAEICTTLRDAAEARAMNTKARVTDSSPFTEEEIQTLKVFAQVAKSKADGTPQSTPVSSSGTPSAPPAPGERAAATPGGASIHQAASSAQPKKARILVAENIRGEAKRYAAPEDEIYVSNPDKVDANGMVSATHLKRGAMLKIPVDDLEWI